MRTLTMLAAILLAVPAAAQPAPKDNKTRMRLQLELELQKAKAVPAVTASPATFTNYELALAESAKTGKPLFVAVGIDCSALCSGLRPAMLTCHVKSLDGVPAGTCLLGMPTGPAAKVMQVSRWIGLPSDVQVKQQVETFRHGQAHQASQPAACLTWADGT